MREITHKKTNEVSYIPNLRLSFAMLLIALVAASALMLSGCEPSKEAISEAKTLIKDAQAHTKNSEYAAAMKKYEKAVALDATNKDAYLGIAEIYIVKNRNAEAQKVLEEGLSKASKKAQICEKLGELAIAEGEKDDAIKYFEKALSENSDMYKSAYLLGLTYVDKGKFEKARDILDVSKDGGEWYARSRLLSAVTYWEKTNAARELLSEITDDKGFDDSVMTLIETYGEDIDRLDALEKDAENVYRDVILAHGALNAGYSSVVVDKLAGYVDDEGEYWDLLFYLGRAYAMEGETKKAQEYLEDAVNLNPADPFGPWYLARVYAKLGMENETQKMYERAISLALSDDKISLRKEYVEVLLERKQYVTFEEQNAILMQEDAKNSMVYHLHIIGSILDRKRYDDAQVSLDKISYAELSGDKKAEYAWLQSRILFAQGERDEALDWAKNAVELSDLVPDYHLLVGQLYYETGDEEKAKASLERAIDLDLIGNVSAEAMKVLDRI